MNQSKHFIAQLRSLNQITVKSIYLYFFQLFGMYNEDTKIFHSCGLLRSRFTVYSELYHQLMKARAIELKIAKSV